VRGRGLPTVVGLLLVLCPNAAPAASQESPGTGSEPTSNREQARVLYETGAAAFEAGDYSTALANLDESYRLFGSLRTLYSLGLCHHRTGNFPAAVRELEQYLREAGADAPAELRTQAEERIAEMRAEMARLDVRVNVDGAEILIDGDVVGSSPLVDPLDVGPGWHVVEARREGYDGEPQRVSVANGTSASVALVLQEQPRPVEPEPPDVGPGPGPAATLQYGPPAGVSEQEWYGISLQAYEDYVYSTGRHQPLANWLLERNRENPDLDLGIILAGSQGLAWLAGGTLTYIFYEHKWDTTSLNYDLPWMSFFEWLLGSTLTVGTIIMLIVDALDLGRVAVEHPERLTAMPAAAPPPAAAADEARLQAAQADGGPAVDVSFGVSGLMLRF